MIHCTASFVDTIRNEKILYDFFCQSNGCFALLHHSLPLKAYKSEDYVKRYRFIFITGLFLLDHVFFWTIRLFFLKKMLSDLWKKIRSGGKTESIDGQVFLYYLSRLPVMVQNSDLKDKVSQYSVLKPSEATPDYPRTKRQVTLVQAAFSKDLWHAYVLSCKEISNTRKEYGAEATYHAMKAYDFHLTRLVLEKNTNITQIVYANMSDRWTCLFSHMEGMEKVLLQHGIIGRGPSEIPRGLLGSVDRLYLISDVFLPYFQHGMKHIGEIRKIQSAFAPVPCEKKVGTVSVLLVTNPSVDFQKEKNILERMLQYPERFDVYLKPHPRFPFDSYYELQKTYDFRLIEDKTFFPAVDAVVSYESTLAWEYESCNTPVYYYDHDSTEEIIENLKSLYANS